jgi:hypothetical protein
MGGSPFIITGSLASYSGALSVSNGATIGNGVSIAGGLTLASSVTQYPDPLTQVAPTSSTPGSLSVTTPMTTQGLSCSTLTVGGTDVHLMAISTVRSVLGI